jgi:hypothetical protein
MYVANMQTWVASSGSTVVEHLPQHPKVQGSSLAATSGTTKHTQHTHTYIYIENDRHRERERDLLVSTEDIYIYIAEL